MKKTLNDFCNELQEISFDKRKVQGLVKRANKAGYNIYYAYHEDGADTWKYGWTESSYKENDNDVKLFKATNLIGKNKPSYRAFTKAHTYTAECAIFVFCPIEQILQDADLREWKIKSVKNKAAQYAAADYKNCIEKKEAFDKWQRLPDENKAEIKRLQNDNFQNVGQPGTAKLHSTYKKDKEEKIKQLGGHCFPLVEWQKEAASFETIEAFIIFRQEKAVKELLSILEIAD
jgi:hypothetical protein